MSKAAIQRWHTVIRDNDTGVLDTLINEDAVFHSPVVHAPQMGKRKTILYLTAAMEVFRDAGFHYLREVIDGRSAVLEFEAQIDGIVINGVDIISTNGQDQITEFKVMIRPLRAITLMHQKMGEMLQRMSTGRLGQER